VQAVNVLINHGSEVGAGKLCSCNIQDCWVKGQPRVIGFSPIAPFNQCWLHPFNKIISSAVSCAIILSLLRCKLQPVLSLSDALVMASSRKLSSHLLF